MLLAWLTLVITALSLDARALTLVTKEKGAAPCVLSHEFAQEHKKFWVCGEILLEQSEWKMPAGNGSESTFFTFQAIAAGSKGGAPNILTVEKVKQQDLTLYNADQYSGLMPPSVAGEQESVTQSFLQVRNAQLALSSGATLESDNDDPARTKGSLDFERIRSRLLSAARVRLNALKNSLEQAKSYEVELESGARVKCRRGKTNPKPDQFTKIASGCELSVCEGVSAAGREWEGLLSHTSRPGGSDPFLVLLGKNELGPPVRIRSTYSAGTADRSKLYELTAEGARTGEIWQTVSPDHSPYYLTDYWDVLREGAAERCLDPKVKQLVEREKSANLRARKGEIVQLVGLVNGVLSSRMLAPGSLPASACRLESGVYAAPDSLSALSGLRGKMRGPSPEALSEEDAAGVMERVKAMKDIPHAYTETGCEARAHVIANRLKDQGLPVEKIWLKGEVFNKKRPGEMWAFHVATAIRVKTPEGKIERRVMDPSLSPSMLREEEWVKLIGWQGDGAPMRVAFPPPNNIAFYGRPALMYSQAELFLPQPPAPGESLEQTLAEARASNLRMQKSLKGGTHGK